MKNIVFQVNIKGVRHKPEFDLSTQSWKKLADKNECEFIAPLRYGDTVNCKIWISAIGTKSCTWNYAKF